MSGVFGIYLLKFIDWKTQIVRELNGLASLQIRKTRMIKFSLKTNFWWRGASSGSILLYTFFHGYMRFR